MRVTRNPAVNPSDWVITDSTILKNRGELITYNGVTNSIDVQPVGTAGQVLVADPTTDRGIRWGSIASGSYVVTQSQSLTSGGWSNIGYFAWLDSFYSAWTSGRLVYYVEINGRNAELRVVNATNAVVIGTGDVISSSGSYQIILTQIPTADSVIEIQGRVSGGGGSNPIVRSAQLEFRI